MLACNPDHLPELPQVGSEGFLRGTGTRARVVRRNLDRTCLVALFVRHPRTGGWDAVRGASGNRVVAEADLYETEEEALHCGRKPRVRISRVGRASARRAAIPQEVRHAPL